MPELNLDLNYFTHPKTKRLVSMLGRGSELLPIRLWCHCGAHHSETGTMTGYSPTEIESLADWRGKPGVMLAAMLKVGFLHETQEGFQIHDWLEHQGHIARFKAKGKAMAEARWRPKPCLQHASSIPASNAASNARAILTEPTGEKEKNGAGAKRLHGIPEAVEEVIEAGRKAIPIAIGESACRAFWSHYESQARTNENGEIFWVTGGQEGTVITNWREKLRNWRDKNHGKNNSGVGRSGPDRNAGIATDADYPAKAKRLAAKRAAETDARVAAKMAEA